MFNSLLILTLISVALAIPSLDHSNLFQRSSLFASECPAIGPVSCQNTSAVTNLCCFESPGGLLLQTQFWDTNPPSGPVNSWTLQGLWPDNCDTTFTENCDPSRDYTGIGTLLTNNGASDTLAFMQQFWVDVNGQNEKLWENEWATHGTCMSTLVPSCLPSGGIRGVEAIVYFQTAVKLFQTLPTFTFLSNAGITPSLNATYTLSQFISALKTGSGGFTPTLSCSGSTVTGISWYFNLQGSVIDGTFIPINAPGSGSCPSTELLVYPPKA